jgi:hypothetical protein
VLELEVMVGADAGEDAVVVVAAPVVTAVDAFAVVDPFEGTGGVEVGEAEEPSFPWEDCCRLKRGSLDMSSKLLDPVRKSNGKARRQGKKKAVCGSDREDKRGR